MIRAVVWTLFHFVDCPLCRWHWRDLWDDLRPSELRYVRDQFWPVTGR